MATNPPSHLYDFPPADAKEVNSQLHVKLDNVKTLICSISCAGDDATREKLQAEAIQIIRKEIESLLKENNQIRTLHKHSRQTIESLENEIVHYRQHFFKKEKFDTAIRLLESSVKTYKMEIEDQAIIIETLFEEKKQFHKHINCLEKTVREKEKLKASLDECEQINLELNQALEQSKRFADEKSEREKELLEENKQFQKDINCLEEAIQENNKLKARLDECEQINLELHQALDQSKRFAAEKSEREKVLLAKMQEAINRGEAAEKTRKETQKRELFLKKECDRMAATLGNVMSEAAKQVDNDMEAMRKKHMMRETSLLKELQHQKDVRYDSETRARRWEHKHREAILEIERLTDELKQASGTLENLERQLREYERSMQEIKMEVLNAGGSGQEIERYKLENQRLTDKYKACLDDATRNLEREIFLLKRENALLQTANQRAQGDDRC